MSYFLKYPVTTTELQKWNKNRNINPRTNRKINSYNKIYKYLEKQFSNINSNKLTLLNVTNNEEPITLEQFYDEKTKKILVNENDYLIWKEKETNRIMALHFESIIGLKNTNNFKHPITHNVIPNEILIKAIKLVKNNPENFNKTESLESLSLRAFQYFNNLSIFIDHLDFIKLTESNLKKLANELNSFFNINLTTQQKSQFNKNVFFTKYKIEDILNEITYLMENTIKKDKIFIAYLILGGLVLVMPKVKKNYPFLEFSFII